MYNPNQTMINQLSRQKDNIENMLNQYQQVPPIQNIINQSTTDFEAKILNDNEDVNNILISKRTMFLDRTNKKIYIKEVDGKISEEYDFIIPKDEKDLKIEELENKLKEMEGIVNEYSKHTKSINESIQSERDVDGDVNTTTKPSTKNVSKSAKG